jgi:hypothetical protein
MVGAFDKNKINFMKSGSGLSPSVCTRNLGHSRRASSKFATSVRDRSGFYSDICRHENARKTQRETIMLFITRFTTVFFLLFILGGTARAQLSSEARISVLTCGPGSDIYSTLGHSAFRVQDPVNSLDVVYNYGTFDFDTPNFYMKFARGRMRYSLSRQRFEDFLYTYQLEKRWVKEQLLQLSGPERNSLFRFLETNYEPANREYNYDFLFDNCSTKIPAVLVQVLGERLEFDEAHLDTFYTFRELIHQYLDVNSWSSLGIDLALGAVIDRKATTYEHMFLPDYVYSQLNHSRLGNKPLVQRERIILRAENQGNGDYFTLTPAFWLLLALLFTVTITAIDIRNATRCKALDFILFFITGITGVLILFLWFLTDHSATAWNFNIFWAFPLNLIMAFFLVRIKAEPDSPPYYLLFLLALLAICLLIWLAGIQVFAPVLLLLWCCLTIRYFFLYRHFRIQQKEPQ